MIAGNFSYMFYMVIFTWIPILIGWTVFHRDIIKHTKPIKKLLLFTTLIFFTWDNIALYYNVWRYDPDQILGIYILLSPIESIWITLSVGVALAFFTIILYEKHRQ